MTISTQFKEAVFLAVYNIEQGRVSSYGKIAELAGYKGYARHVGKLLSALPKDSEIPWHRVIRSDGCIAFEPGTEPFAAQQSRLKNEGIEINSRRVAKRYFI